MYTLTNSNMASRPQSNKNPQTVEYISITIVSAPKGQKMHPLKHLFTGHPRYHLRGSFLACK